MADFNDSTWGIKKTLDLEGGYSFDPNDNGGETMMGLTREADADSPMWGILDAYKAQTSDRKEFGKLYGLCKTDKAFMELVYDRYKKAYWDAVLGDEIKDQRVAWNIFDFAVNAGVSKASEKAQIIVGTRPDGDIGPITIKAINSYNPEQFVSEYKVKRASYYQAIVDNHPDQQVFLNGWLNRVEQC